MDHQPFETFILDPNSQSPQNTQALQQHLQVCASCRALQENWLAVERSIKRSPQLAPRPGFNSRWQSSLAGRQKRQQVHQVRILLLSLGIGSLVSLVALILVFSTVASPIDLVIGGARIITTLNGWLVSLQDLLGSVFASPLPLAIWIVAGTGFCLLVTSWLIALWRISYKGASVK